MIEARGITRRFGRTVAVRDVSFSVPGRCVCGVLGPNGAGKTTTIRMLAGLLLPDEGTLTVAGFDVVEAPDEVRRRVGYLPESAPLPPDLRVREVLRYRAGLLGLAGDAARRAIDESIAACDLGPVAGRLVSALSKGFRQRTGLAAALLGSPEAVILDEPSVGLDPAQLVAFRALLRRLAERSTVLLSSHQLAEVEAACDRAILIRGGTIVAEGPIERLRERAGRPVLAVESRCPDLAAVLPAIGSPRPAAPRPGGWFRQEIELRESESDPREALVARLVAAGVAFREIHLERASLERLFLAGEPGAAGA
jgi:ABC-2 type transport system ATP-binding protein